MALSLRAGSTTRCCSAAASRRVPRVVLVRAAPSKDLNTAVQDAVKAAEDTCAEKGVKNKECEVAWDQAEELLAAKDKKKRQEAENADPLEQYCKDSPDADECRVHEL